MAKMAKNVIFGSWAVAGIVALLSILDLIMAFPFQGQMIMDILFLLGAGMVGYMGWDSYRDLR